MTTTPAARKRAVKVLRDYLEDDRRNYTAEFVQLPPTPPSLGATPPILAWRNRDFLAQLFVEGDDGEHLRLTINRAYINATGAWSDGITWDELMAVKAGCGYGDRWAIEVYPPDDGVVNVANMRHLWLVDEPPPFAWTPPRGDDDAAS